jgi:hypothetical protein
LWRVAHFIQQIAEFVIAAGFRHWLFYELRLPALPVRSNHQPACQPVGDLSSATLTYQMQTAVQRCSCSGGSHDAALFNVNHICIEHNLRKALANHRHTPSA